MKSYIFVWLVFCVIVGGGITVYNAIELYKSIKEALSTLRSKDNEDWAGDRAMLILLVMAIIFMLYEQTNAYYYRKQMTELNERVMKMASDIVKTHVHDKEEWWTVW